LKYLFEPLSLATLIKARVLIRCVFQERTPQLFEVLSGGDVRLLRFDCLAGSCFGEEEEGNAIAGSGEAKGGLKKLGQIFSGHVETMMNIYGQFE